MVDGGPSGLIFSVNERSPRIEAPCSRLICVTFLYHRLGVISQIEPEPAQNSVRETESNKKMM